MMLLFRMLLFASRSKRGRRFLMLGVLSAMRLARRPTARAAYFHAWRIVTDPKHRKAALKVARSAGGKARRR
jgi:hypothetical protein